IEAKLERQQGSNVWLTFAMREGKNREVRNVLGHLGLKVNRLIRLSFGPFQLGELTEGGIEEVRTRTLREQLGERVVALAGADFSAPIRPRQSDPPPPRRTAAAEPGGPPRTRSRQQRRSEPKADPAKLRRAPSSRARQRESERLGEPALARRERRNRRR